MQEALLSVLAGDIFRGTPVGFRLLAVQGRCTTCSALFNPKTAVKAWLRRKQVIRGDPGRAVRPRTSRPVGGQAIAPLIEMTCPEM